MAKSTVAQKPLAVYTRVSEQGARSDEELLSHDVQRDKVGSYLNALSLPAAKERFEDNSRSGRKMSRPAFDKVMEGIRSGKLGGIAIYKLSRFGRNTVGVLKLVRELDEMGAKFVCVQPAIDTSTANGRFMLTVFAALDELEAERAVEEAGVITEKKLDEGLTTGGTAPVGYEWEVTGKDSNGKDILGWLVPSAQFETVKEARLGFASGRFETPGKVADFLNAAGIRTRKTKRHPGGGDWNHRNTTGFLKRHVYAGVAEGNRQHTEMHDTGVQRVIDRKVAPKTMQAPRTMGEGHLLGRGLLRCAKCHGSLGKSSAGGSYQTLRCNGRGPGHSAISYGQAEEWIVSSAFIHGVSVDDYAGNLVGLRTREALVARRDEAQAAYDEMAQALGMDKLPEGSTQAQALAVAEDALFTHDAERDEDEAPAVMNREQFEALESLTDRIKALRSIVSEVVVHPGVKGSRKQDMLTRMTLKFADGTQYPAVPAGRTPFTVIEEREEREAARKTAVAS